MTVNHSPIDKQYTHTVRLKATDGYFVWLTIIINHSSLGTHALSRVSTFSGWQPRQRFLKLRSHWLATTLVTPPSVGSTFPSCVSLQSQLACKPALSASFSRLCSACQAEVWAQWIGDWPWIILPFQPTRMMRDSVVLLFYKNQPREWALLLPRSCFIRQGWAYMGQ